MLLDQWVQYKDELLNECAWLESSPLLMCLPGCITCSTSNATLCCIDCFTKCLFHQECVIVFHCRELFHHIQVLYIYFRTFSWILNTTQQWAGTHFVLISLKDLGTVFRLSHAYSNICSIPSFPTSLMVFDVTGVHVVSITYCKCDPDGSAIPLFVQLLCVWWFPATWWQPGTAFTFHSLDFLHKLHSGCKVNLYDFHGMATATSDNAGLGKHVVSPNLRPTYTSNLSLYSSDTTNCVWCSAYTYSCTNSNKVDAVLSLVECLQFQRGAWWSIARRAHIQARTLTCPKNNYWRNLCKPTTHLKCSYLSPLTIFLFHIQHVPEYLLINWHKLQAQTEGAGIHWSTPRLWICIHGIKQ